MKIGDTYGRWTVLAAPEGDRTKCRCECGKVKRVLTDTLRGGRSKSCGCRIKEHHNAVMGKWFKGSAQRRAAHAAS